MLLAILSEEIEVQYGRKSLMVFPKIAWDIANNNDMLNTSDWVHESGRSHNSSLSLICFSQWSAEIQPMDPTGTKNR